MWALYGTYPGHCSGQVVLPCKKQSSSRKPEIQTDCEIASFLSVAIRIFFFKDPKDKLNICGLDISVGWQKNTL